MKTEGVSGGRQKSHEGTIKVVIADGHASIREMLSMVLLEKGPYRLVAEAGTGFEAIDRCRKTKPDLLILDSVLPELNGAAVIRQLRPHTPETKFLVYSTTIIAELVHEILQEHPHGFVQKSDPLAVFRQALQAVVAGSSYFNPIATRLFGQALAPARHREALTECERAVLHMIAEGLSNKEMGQRLSLATKSVERHRAYLMKKLGLHDVARLTRYAIRLGLVSAEI